MKSQSLSLSANDKLSFVSNLATMIIAGIPILEALDSLLEEGKGDMKKILEIIREDIMQGRHLYASFSNFPKIFDKVTVNIVRASEEAGTLGVTLKDLKEQIIKEMEFNDRIKSALIYPAFIIIIFIAVLLLILIVVIPKISSVFLRLNVTLPISTRILIYVSNFMLTNTVVVLAGVVGFCVGIFFFFKVKKTWALRILYSLPLVSGLVKEIDLTRFSRSMYLLLTSGITITYALELSQDVVMRSDVASAIGYARDMVLAGKDLSDGFKQRRKIFSGIMIKILEAGEKTGTLDKSMQDTSEFLDYQISKTLKTLTTMVEPIMLVFVGIMVGGMMLAVISPIYGLIGQVGGR